MAKLYIARPNLPEDRRKELCSYLIDKWDRAVRARSEQVDSDYARWSKAYKGVPLERERTIPFYKSSNFVVKLIRIYVDTFVARTLNIIFATRPLYTVAGLPRDVKEAWEYYLNAKALDAWSHYKLAHRICDYGARNGSVVAKTVYTVNSSIEVNATGPDKVEEQEVISFEGPMTKVIPFEDWYVYPFSAQDWDDVVVKFHRIRFPEEFAREQLNQGKWTLQQPLSNYLRHPRDTKKTEAQSDAGITDSHYQEFTAVECHLRYATSNDPTKLYDIVATIHPDTQELIDLYYNPYPRNLNVFNDYRPFPQEDVWYGESMCEILSQSQEEASVIHNDRRNNSFIANTVTFKRRSGSLVPNPSTNWYPGKVWDLEDLDDLEVMTVGAQYPDMIQQEDYVFRQADQLSGIGETMRGTSEGQQGARGVYNTMGTLSVMAEGNQRQDTNIKVVRDSLSQLADTCSRMQARFGADDPFISTLPAPMQPLVQQAFEIFNSDRYRLIKHDVAASNAGVNSQVERASLLQISQVLGQYGGLIQQLLPQVIGGQLNPQMTAMLMDIISMQSSMAKRLLNAFGEPDLVEALPDVNRILSAGSGTTQQGMAGQREAGLDPVGAGESLPPLSGPQLVALSKMAGQARSGA